ADYNNVTSYVTAIDVGQLHPGQSFTNPQVEMIQRTSPHADQDLVRSRTRISNVLKLENLRSAKLMESNGLHGNPKCLLLATQNVGKDQRRHDRRVRLNDELRCVFT